MCHLSQHKQTNNTFDSDTSPTSFIRCATRINLDFYWVFRHRRNYGYDSPVVFSVPTGLQLKTKSDYNLGMPSEPGKRETYQEDEYFDVGEEVARSWSELEAFRESARPKPLSPAREVPIASEGAPNTIGRLYPTVGDVSGSLGRTIGGE